MHVNVGWVSLTGYSAMECEGRVMSSFLDKCKDVNADFGFKHLHQVFVNLKAFTATDEKVGDNKNLLRDAHSPSSYETSEVYLIKKSRSNMNSCANIVYGSDYSPSSSPVDVASFIPSPFGSPTISRKGSVSSDSCEIRWDAIRSPTGMQGLRTQLSVVPIGTNHFAVLCLPVSSLKRPF